MDFQDRLLATRRDPTHSPRSRDRAAEALRQRIRDLEARNAELVEFAHFTAHDLKEPLSTVGLFADTLDSLQGGALDDRGRRMLHGIRDGIDQMRRTIDGALAGAEQRRDEEEQEQVDMGGVVDQALRAVGWRLEHGSVRVKVGEMPTVLGSRAQLTRLMQNLFANALEFAESAQRSWIAVEAQRQPDSWLFQVSDDGPGISTDDPQRLFERYERGDRRGGGLGLGLTICRAVVEQHGGRISIQARPGGGTVVSFTLPATSPRRLADARPIDRLRGA
ncbi:MAG TPA: ATP-binding protein [Thermoleophilaceae bacterium]|nr:ATP-binding protein [Thermoleophilaceae bacterium]